MRQPLLLIIGFTDYIISPNAKPIKSHKENNVPTNILHVTIGLNVRTNSIRYILSTCELASF